MEYTGELRAPFLETARSKGGYPEWIGTQISDKTYYVVLISLDKVTLLMKGQLLSYFAVLNKAIIELPDSSHAILNIDNMTVTGLVVPSGAENIQYTPFGTIAYSIRNKIYINTQQILEIKTFGDYLDTSPKEHQEGFIESLLIQDFAINRYYIACSILNLYSESESEIQIYTVDGQFITSTTGNELPIFVDNGFLLKQDLYIPVNGILKKRKYLLSGTHWESYSEITKTAIVVGEIDHYQMYTEKDFGIFKLNTNQLIPLEIDEKVANNIVLSRDGQYILAVGREKTIIYTYDTNKLTIMEETVKRQRM